MEKELKAQGKKLDEEGKEIIRKKYRRRPVTKVMEEIEDEIKDNFAEHQLKIELIQIMQDELNDLSGASKPVEVKLFGPDQKQLRTWPTDRREAGEERQGPRHQGGQQQRLRGQPGPDDRGRHRACRPSRAEAGLMSRQLKAMFQGQIATQVRESSARITDVRVRYPDSVRFGGGRFDPARLLNQWILLPEGKAAPSALPASPAGGAGTGRARCLPWPASGWCEHPTSSGARTSSRPSSSPPS